MVLRVLLECYRENPAGHQSVVIERQTTLIVFHTLLTFSDIHLYINTGWLSLFHVPSTFAPANTHANVFFVFLPGGISKEWRHIVSANCKLLPRYRIMFTGLLGNTCMGRPKITRESQNDVRRLCWPNLGCESPLAEPPRGSLCWENLCGWGRLVGGH